MHGSPYRITLKGALGHAVALGSDIHGNITRLDNVFEAFAVKQSACEEQLQNLHVQMENAKTEAKRPFPKEAELKEKTARLAELNIALNMDKKEKESAEFDSESEEVEPETRHSQSRDAR